MHILSSFNIIISKNVEELIQTLSVELHLFIDDLQHKADDGVHVLDDPCSLGLLDSFDVEGLSLLLTHPIVEFVRIVVSLEDVEGEMMDVVVCFLAELDVSLADEAPNILDKKVLVSYAHLNKERCTMLESSFATISYSY